MRTILPISKWYCGEILRDRRKELGMTQKEPAEQMRKKRAYINRIEKGGDSVEVKTISLKIV